MNITRIVGLSYAILVMLLALAATVFRVQPARFFIDLTTVDGKFYGSLIFLLSALTLLLPGFLLLVLISFLRRNKNVIPDTTGKTGILLTRKRSLYNAAFNFHVWVDGVKVGSVGNGQRLFVELTAGKHTISIKDFKTSNHEFDLKFGTVMNLETRVKEEGLRANVIIVPTLETTD